MRSHGAYMAPRDERNGDLELDSTVHQSVVRAHSISLEPTFDLSGT